MLLPICQEGDYPAFKGSGKVTKELQQKWAANFDPYEKVPVTPGHLPSLDEETIGLTALPPLCWVSYLTVAGEFLMAMFTDWTEAGKRAALDNQFKNFSIETDASGERIKAVAALGAYDAAVDFHTDAGRFQPLDFAQGALGDTGRILLAQAMASFAGPISMPYKSPPKKITDVFNDEAGPDAWTKAFNAAFKQYDGDEAKANATAWTQIEKMGYEKGKDGKYHKPKEAAKAAKETKMGIKERVKEALSALLAKLDEEGDEAPGTAAPPNTTVEPVVAPGVSESPQLAVMAAQMKALETRVTESEQRVIAVTAKGQALAFRQEANLPPALDVALGDMYAGKTEVRMDEEGTKKLPTTEFVERLVKMRGTQKLTVAVLFGEPPVKTEVETLLVEGKIDAEAVQKKAREVALASSEKYETVLRKLYPLVQSGKSLDEAVALVAATSKGAK